GPQSQFVALGAQPGNDTDRHVGKVRVVTEGLAGVNVGKVDLDERNLPPQQGIPQGDAGMGEGGGIDDDEGYALVASGVDAFDQFVLPVALEAFTFMTLAAG